MLICSSCWRERWAEMRCIECQHIDYITPSADDEKDKKYGKSMKGFGVCKVAEKLEHQAAFAGMNCKCFTGRFEHASEELITGRINWYQKRSNTHG